MLPKVLSHCPGVPPDLTPSCLPPDRALYQGTVETQEVVGAGQVVGLRRSVCFLLQRIPKREQNGQLHGGDLSCGEKQP